MSKNNIIQVSFKNTKKEQALLECVNVQEEKSQFVKDALDYYIRYLKGEFDDEE